MHTPCSLSCRSAFECQSVPRGAPIVRSVMVLGAMQVSSLGIVGRSLRAGSWRSRRGPLTVESGRWSMWCA